MSIGALTFPCSNANANGYGSVSVAQYYEFRIEDPDFRYGIDPLPESTVYSQFD